MSLPREVVRVGTYATYRDCDYLASFSFYESWVTLATVEAQAAPPHPEWSQDPDGRWTATVRRNDLERLYAAGAVALWKGRYAVRITSVRDTEAQFEWNPAEIDVGREFGLDGRGPSPEQELVLKRPEGSMAGCDLLEQFQDIRTGTHEYSLEPPPRRSQEAHLTTGKRGKPPRHGH